MSNHQIHRLQQKLTNLVHEQQQLQQEKSSFLKLIQQLTTRNRELEHQNASHPIKLLIQRNDPHDIENKIYQLQDKLTRQSSELSFYEQSHREKFAMISQLQVKKNQLFYQLEAEKMQSQTRDAKLKEEKQKNQLLLKRIHKLTGQIDDINNQRLALITQNSQLKGKIKNDQKKYHLSLEGLIKQVKAYQCFLNKPQSQEQIKNQNQQELSRILNEQMTDLQQRNNQLQNLKMLCEGSIQSIDESHLKNTIKNLRKQIRNYSDFAEKVIQKLKFAEKTVKKYTDLTKRCQIELSTVENLREQQRNYLQTIKRQKDEINNLNSQIDNHSKESENTLKTMLQLLLQNQNYHDLMFSCYGQNSHMRIKAERIRYEERLRARQGKQEWANLQELISVNQALKVNRKK